MQVCREKYIMNLPLKNIDIKKIRSEINGLKKSLLNYRFQKSTGQLEKTSEIRKTRKKIAKLKTNKNAAMLFYDKEEKIQVRLKVECTINHDNEITKESWLKTGHMSRKCYLVDNGPGTKSSTPTSGLKPELDNFDFTMEQSEEGYKNFTVIQCKIKTLEWLYLAAKGHRRARLEFSDYTKGYWLIP